MIQSSSTIFKKDASEIIRSRKRKWNLHTSPPFPSYDILRWCCLYWCDCRFLQSGNHNIICQPSSLLAMKERNFDLRSIFQSSLQSTPFQYFSSRLVGTCYWYYYPSLLYFNYSYLYFHELLARNPIQTITITQSNIKVKSCHSETVTNLKKATYITCSERSPQQSPYVMYCTVL
jgi:hypothetical protein